MLVRLRNNGVALRIMHDINKVQRQIRPGHTLEIDLHEAAVKRYLKSQRLGDDIAVEDINDDDRLALEHSNPGDQELGRKSAFTLRPGEGVQAQSLQEALGHSGQPQRSHGGEDNDPATDKGKGLGAPDGNEPNEPKPGEEPANEQDRIAAEAVAAAQREAERNTQGGTETKKDPETATELLTVYKDLSKQELIRLATKILPRDSIPRNANPGKIAELLQKQAAKDAKK